MGKNFISLVLYIVVGMMTYPPLDIVIAADLPFLKVEVYHTVRMDSHLCSYLISRTFEKRVIYLPSLQSPCPHIFWG